MGKAKCPFVYFFFLCKQKNGGGGGGGEGGAGKGGLSLQKATSEIVNLVVNGSLSVILRGRKICDAK